MRSGEQVVALPNPPIFIVGHARSGTTWLFDILTAHPQVAGVFESWMFTRTNGFIPLLKAHWKDGQLARKKEVIGRESGLGQLISREETFETVRQVALGWLSRKLEPGQQFLVEKGPGEYDVMDELFPDARFVHMLRDGRDVAVSMHHASRGWAPEMLPYVGRSITGSGRLWREEIVKIRELADSVGDRFIEVRYENLRANPLLEARKMFSFCGIDCSDEQLDQILTDTSFEVQKSKDRSGFVRSGRVGDWQERFTRLDALRFDRMAGDMLLSTGYTRSRWWWLGHRRKRTGLGAERSLGLGP